MAPGKGCDNLEIRVTPSGSERGYVAYALGILQSGRQTQSLQGSDSLPCQRTSNHGRDPPPQGSKTVVLWAVGTAMTKCVSVCEIVKRQRPGLHQWTQISSMTEAVVSCPASFAPFYTVSRPTLNFFHAMVCQGAHKRRRRCIPPNKHT